MSNKTPTPTPLCETCLHCSDDCPHKGTLDKKIEEVQLSAPNGTPVVATLDELGQCCLFSGTVSNHSNEIWLHAANLKYLEERGFKRASW